MRLTIYFVPMVLVCACAPGLFAQAAQAAQATRSDVAAPRRVPVPDFPIQEGY